MGLEDEYRGVRFSSGAGQELNSENGESYVTKMRACVLLLEDIHVTLGKTQKIPIKLMR